MRKYVVVVAALLGLCGCTSDVETYYVATKASIAQPVHTGADVSFYASTGNPEADIDKMFTEGLGVVGEADYTGSQIYRGYVVEQAQKVGATAVIMNSSYVTTVANSSTYNVPVTSTTTFSGTVRTSAPTYSSAKFSGTATTEQYNTVSRSSAYALYDHVVLFLAPIPRSGLGLHVVPMTDAEIQVAQTTTAGSVRSVRQGSPAALADVIPGDILLSVGGAREMPGQTAALVASQCFGKTCELVFLRQGQKRSVSITLGPKGEWQ